MRQPLSQAYAELGLIQAIVDTPVEDGLRGGVEIKTKQLDEEEIAALVSDIEEFNDYETLGDALKWNRLFGGAAILVMTDQDPSTPLDIDSLGPDDNLEFKDCDLWELYGDRLNTEASSPFAKMPELECYSYYGVQIHHTRVMTMKGRKAPSFIRPRLRGWGMSVVETLVRSINQYLKSNDLTFEVLDEFKLDIFKISGLANTLLSPEGTRQIHDRVQLANLQKNYNNALTMDKEDDYDHKELSFTGMAEIMSQIRMQVASDMRMPLTKLFGISAAGFNSGEDDIEVYNSMVETQVRTKCKYI